ncbi:MAG: radical SAM protein [Desulfobacterales bacterium]|nr:radical SAM protein [Desulfobacterales bacterium]
MGQMEKLNFLITSDPCGGFFMPIQEQEIQYILDNVNWVNPLFEDEVPNTFPVSRIYSWETIDDVNVEKVIKHVRETPPRSLYVGIPYCKSKCKYCIYRPETKSPIPSGYLGLLGNEFKKYSELGVSFNSIRQIYVGGGTPSLLSGDQMKELFRLLEEYVSLNNISSFCFEFDPTTCTKEKVNFLHKSGVNRFSIGVQCLDDKVLVRQNRKALSRDIKKALGVLTKKEVYYNVDLIYGLPDQSQESWLNSLRTLVDEFAVPEFTLYKFRVGRETELTTCHSDCSQDNRVLEKQMFAEAVEFLSKQSYEQVRPCHWVANKFKKDWESYLFAPMSDQTATLKQIASQIGIGGDAISHVNGLLVRNHKAELYIEKMEGGSGFAYESYYSMTGDDIAIRKILLSIEKNQRITAKWLPSYTTKLRQNLDKLCKPNLGNKEFDFSKEQEEKSCNPLLSKKKDEFILTGNGLLFYDYIENLIIYEIKKFDDRVAFSAPVEENDWVEKVTKKIISHSTTDQELNVLELGAGVGALSIPVLRHLAELKEQNKLNWTAYDNDLDKLLYYYEQYLHKACSAVALAEGNSKEWCLKVPENTKVTLIHSNIESELLCRKPDKIYDVIFMPSFLNHISLKMDCLRFAWESLKENGLVVLGYPSGAWFSALIGPTWKYDQENDRSKEINKCISKLWHAYFDISPNFEIYFTRPIDDFGKALPGKMETENHALRVPNINTFWHFLLNDSFSFLRSRTINTNDKSTSFKCFARLQTEVRNLLRDGIWQKESPFAYTWQFVSKRKESE